MSLGILFKGPEGIVLAVDSRVTLMAKIGTTNNILPAYYDNATKLLKINGQNFVAAVTYGAGAIGQQQPRTAHSFVPEFEAELIANDVGRLPVEQFAVALSDFFLKQWKALMPSNYSGADMVFLIGGYDEGEPYGRMFEVQIPSNPQPVERNPAPGFGLIWGGQREYIDRLIRGHDDALLEVAQKSLGLNDKDKAKLGLELQQAQQLPIPFQFLPLQDCVDLAMFLVRATMDIQTFLVGVRGVGGDIDVATITRTDGFVPIQQKTITGEE